MSDLLTEPETSQDSEIEEKKTSGSDSREYLVLVEQGPDVFKIVKKVEASNAEGAIKDVEPDPTKRYAAVPARNWNVGKPSVRTVTQVSIDFE